MSPKLRPDHLGIDELVLSGLVEGQECYREQEAEDEEDLARTLQYAFAASLPVTQFAPQLLRDPFLLPRSHDLDMIEQIIVAGPRRNARSAPSRPA